MFYGVCIGSSFTGQVRVSGGRSRILLRSTYLDVGFGEFRTCICFGTIRLKSISKAISLKQRRLAIDPRREHDNSGSHDEQLMMQTV